jgi:hypothetical protein
MGRKYFSEGLGPFSPAMAFRACGARDTGGVGPLLRGSLITHSEPFASLGEQQENRELLSIPQRAAAVSKAPVWR